MNSITFSGLELSGWQAVAIHGLAVCLLLAPVPALLFAQRLETYENRGDPSRLPAMLLALLPWLFPIWILAGFASSVASWPVGASFAVFLLAAAPQSKSIVLSVMALLNRGNVKSEESQ